MCEPTTIALIAASVSIASTAASSAVAKSQADSQAALADAQYEQDLLNMQAQMGQEAEAAAQAKFNRQREASAEQGKLMASGLSNRSIATLGRSIGFDLGQDIATMDRNLEIKGEQMRAQLNGIEMQRASDEAAHAGAEAQFAVGMASAAVQGVSTGFSVGEKLDPGFTKRTLGIS